MPVLSNAQKFRIREGTNLLVINAPDTFEAALQPLPKGVVINGNTAPDQIHLFIRTKAELEKHLSKLVKKLKEDTLFWIYFPKGSSKMQTDITRDKGWEALEAHPLQRLSLVSLDNNWSAFSLRLEGEKGPRTAKPATAPELDLLIDKEARTVKLPVDLKAALQQHPPLLKNFESLAFTHKKEYVEWIVSAKKEETRQSRVAKAVEMMLKGAKNPSDR